MRALHISGDVVVFMGTATIKLETSHKITSMYLYLSLEGGICFISIER